MLDLEEDLVAEKLISVPADKAWEILSCPSALVYFHPFVKENPTEQWDGVECNDSVIYYSGLEYKREVLEWVSGEGFILLVSKQGKPQLTVKFRIIPVSDQQSNLRVSIQADLLHKFPSPIRKMFLKFKLKPTFEPYLSKVQQGFADFAESGVKVLPDQYGPLSPFSASK
ncbi:hypothetical protein [Paraferrimonas haliotis]|uniref:SRPBCC family protein n=1 Tax=Paraferrimonas haliotis TaxID=2013866 RepID=A0AA37TW89_9GAMM|nr:hypothetical protein [Paraferrimonas haliotis]GLS84309.1 hypothetical protein GCM10007894_22860 [Paraferrimonas haliotis]